MTVHQATISILIYRLARESRAGTSRGLKMQPNKQLASPAQVLEHNKHKEK
jgi:hypothetical protein